MTEAFDLATAPLHGSNLIEANAGTGKTYSITGLYLRYLLEQGRPFDQILVVTFTRSATHEVRVRIMARLQAAYQRLTSGEATADPLIESLAHTIESHPDPQHSQQAAQRLALAIRGFDLARITTIHGFCDAMLAQHAFSMGHDPDRELIENPQVRLRPLIQRCWQQHAEQLDSTLIEAVGADEQWLDRLTRLVIDLMDKPGARLDRPAGADPMVRLEALNQDYLNLISLWREHHPSIRALLHRKQGLNQQSYKPAQIDRHLSALERAIEGGLSLLASIRTLPVKLGQQSLIAGCKNGVDSSDLVHPVFEWIDRLIEQMADLDDTLAIFRIDLAMTLYQRVLPLWREQLDRQALRTHGESISRLASALAEEDSENLAQRIGETLQVALVDEFQDTDPEQYRIFKRLFVDASRPIWFVGDPKQSIYRFRGADVHAYLKARDDCDRRYTLSCNWRSSPALIDAVNQLYVPHRKPFVIEGIDWHSSEAADRAHDPVPGLNETHGPRSPITALLAQSDRGNSKELAIGNLSSLCAREISALLVEGVPGGDIAVLVRTHAEGLAVTAALNAVGIRSVTLGRTTVFESDACQALIHLMRALLSPADRSRVNAVLASRLFGHTAVQIAQLNDHESESEALRLALFNHRRTWQHVGLLAVVHALLLDSQRAGEVLAHQGGERWMTDLFHLLELITEYAHQQLASPAMQLDWLREQQADPPQDSQSVQVRLDSDDHLVQVMTVHKSKGLEFPVVFCPFLCLGRSTLLGKSVDGLAAVAAHKQFMPVQSHDLEDDLVVDSGTPRYVERAHADDLESAAEDQRLQYVAMTRAADRLYLGLHTTRSLDQSPLAWLLCGDASATAGCDLETLCSALRERQLVILGDEDVPTGQWTGHDADEVFTARDDAPQPTVAFDINSYSQLARMLEEKLDAAELDRDAHEPTHTGSRTPSPMAGINRLPPGAHSGNCVHDMLEHLPDFDLSRDAMTPLIEQRLTQYQLDAGLAVDVATHLERVLSHPLRLPGAGPTRPRMHLGALARSDRVSEMEFHAAMPPQMTDALLSDLVPDWTPAAGQAALVQFTHGYIDLVFRWQGRYYVVDYKTNTLGDTADDYSLEAMSNAMDQHRYDLQYHLYALAMDRYLDSHLTAYDSREHFGGVLYLFLRGMAWSDDPDDQRGVFTARPSDDWLERYR